MEGLIHDLLRRSGDNDEKLCSGIEQLAARLGPVVYQEILRQLTSKTYPPEIARRHWEQALRHRDQLFPESGRVGGLRPALLDYLHSVAHEITDPRIVEAGLLEDFRQASITDGLTGLYHQTYFKAHLEKLASSRKSPRGNRFAVLLMDLDHFKQYNDRCGHLAGDHALKLTAEILQLNLRQGDLACRYGGEEFALLLPRIGAHEAFDVAERIRLAIEEANYPGQDLMDRRNLTISIGIAVYPDHASSAGELLALADEELYRAKEHRNTTSPSQNGQRREIRHKLLSLVEFTLVPGEPCQPGLSFDISRTGISFGCSMEQATPGASLELRFKQPFWRSNCELLGTIRHIRKHLDSGLVRIGLEFVGTAETVLAILPERPRPLPAREPENP